MSDKPLSRTKVFIKSFMVEVVKGAERSTSKRRVQDTG